MRLLLQILLFLLPLAAAAQSSLPSCGTNFAGSKCWGQAKVGGDTYVGEFSGGQIDGQGILYDGSGSVRRAGIWMSGAFIESRILSTRNFPFSKQEFERLVAELESANSRNAESAPASVQPTVLACPQNGVRHNCWTQAVMPGNIPYVGEFQNGKRHGLGSVSIAFDGKYVGEWRDDMRDGLGILYNFAGGVLRAGVWREGRLIRDAAVDAGRFPFEIETRFSSGSERSTVETQSVKAERDRLAGEIEASRKRQQELEEQLARERERAGVVSTGAQRPPQTASIRTERRVALIIGNSAYRGSPLVNPVNDASDLDATLRGLGFKTTLIRDATIIQMRNVTRQFAEDVASSDVALIFFAGHGIEAKGRNYLIPVSADIKHEYELEDQAYDAGRWLDMLESIKGNNRQRVNVVILDACRNNELARGWRSASRGLARMDAPTGTFVAFATAPGRVALDGGRGQRNSPFTKNLLRAIQTPDLPIELMFKEVRRLVLEETKNEQVPWDNSSLVGDFVFKRSR